MQWLKGELTIVVLSFLLSLYQVTGRLQTSPTRHQESRFEGPHESYAYQQLSIRRLVEQVRTSGTQKDPDSCL